MSKKSPVQRKMVYEAVDDLIDVVQYGNSSSKLKHAGKRREEQEGCRWRLIHRGKPIPEKQLHRSHLILTHT